MIFHRSMFPQQSHILALLTASVTGKGPIQWSTECQASFNTMKALLAKDAFLWYPDHNKRFDIYCDASDLQLGATILQEGMPVAYYSCKLNSAQHNYTVGEKEILSIVETLKEFHTMLYGCPNTHVFTDYKNNMSEHLQTQHVLRWHLFLDAIPSNSTTSKVTATCLLTCCPVYLLMRDRKPMLCLVIKTKFQLWLWIQYTSCCKLMPEGHK
jgi:RNase H-like domain found in reverse transcriptase